jgi:serine/threonine-protein kinase HipA
MNCRGCLKENKEEYCRPCLKELFDGKKVRSVLTFNSHYKEESELFQKHTNHISISGVQVKYSLRLEENELHLTEQGGQYILKPVPTGTFKNLDQAPANEHLTMQIAKQAFKLSVPPNGLTYFKDGSPAYLVKRFDQTPERKLNQEDFAQIAEMTSDTHGKNYKYDFSYEEIAALIKKHIPTYRYELEKYFRLILFNHLISNGDAHLKNFSAIQSANGDYLLTPCYDLLCTRVHSPYESEMALDLFKTGLSNTYETYGYYTYRDFCDFGIKIGIKESRVEKIITEFSKSNPIVYSLITKSFLNDELKAQYKKHYDGKLRQLNMRD